MADPTTKRTSSVPCPALQASLIFEQIGLLLWIARTFEEHREVGSRDAFDLLSQRLHGGSRSHERRWRVALRPAHRLLGSPNAVRPAAVELQNERAQMGGQAQQLK